MKQTEFLSECSSRFQETCTTQIQQNSEPSRTSTTALGHVLPLKFCQLSKRFQIHTLHTKGNRNSSELIRTDPNTDGQQQTKHTKQIQKLFKTTFDFGKLFRKKHNRQTSIGTMSSSPVTFPITNGRKMQETRTMSILPFSN